jgi:hypothetical protein
MDILYLVTRYKDRVKEGSFKSIVTENAITLPILWVLKHTERVFGVSLCEEAGFVEPVSESWLASWQTGSFQTSYWKGTMRERLQKKNREELFLRNS